MKLYIAKIEEALEADAINNELKKIVSIFLAAVNDWPDLILNFEDYELEIEKYLNCKTTKDFIMSSLERIDISKDAWRLESLSEILEVFKFYTDGISLKEIIEELKNKLCNLRNVGI